MPDADNPTPAPEVRLRCLVCEGLGIDTVIVGKDQDDADSKAAEHYAAEHQKEQVTDGQKET